MDTVAVILLPASPTSDTHNFSVKLTDFSFASPSTHHNVEILKENSVVDSLFCSKAHRF